MKSDAELRTALISLEKKPLSGTTNRVVSIKYAHEPLNAIGSKFVGGRYNTKNGFEVLYLALNPVTALLETGLAHTTAVGIIGMPATPRAIFTVHFDLRKTIDLQNLEVQTALGTNPQELTGEWKYAVSMGLEPETQRLGRMVQEIGEIDALIVPSARHLGYANLAVFTSALTQTSGNIRVQDPDGLVQNKQFP